MRHESNEFGGGDPWKADERVPIEGRLPSNLGRLVPDGSFVVGVNQQGDVGDGHRDFDFLMNSSTWSSSTN